MSFNQIFNTSNMFVYFHHLNLQKINQDIYLIILKFNVAFKVQREKI